MSICNTSLYLAKRKCGVHSAELALTDAGSFEQGKDPDRWDYSLYRVSVRTPLSDSTHERRAMTGAILRCI